MAIGRTFKESLQKCLRSLDIGRHGLGATKPWRIGGEVYGYRDILPRELIRQKNSVRPTPKNILFRHALRAGLTIEEIFRLTSIDWWFLAPDQRDRGPGRAIGRHPVRTASRRLTVSKTAVAAAKSAMTKAAMAKASSTPSRAPTPTPTAANHNIWPVVIGITIIRVNAVIRINDRRRGPGIRVWIHGGRRCAGHDHRRNCVAGDGLIIGSRCRRRLLLLLIDLGLLLVGRIRLFLQFAVAANQSRRHLLRHAQMLQINNSVRIEMERQNGVLNIADQNILVDSALGTFLTTSATPKASAGAGAPTLAAGAAGGVVTVAGALFESVPSAAARFQGTPMETTVVAREMRLAQ